LFFFFASSLIALITFGTLALLAIFLLLFRVFGDAVKWPEKVRHSGELRLRAVGED